MDQTGTVGRTEKKLRKIYNGNGVS